MKITEKIIPINKYNRPGTTIKPKRICVHYTGDCGKSASQLVAYWNNVAKGVFKDKPWSWTSAQYIIGLDGEITRCIPDNEMAYAAANQNVDTIHIEVCYKKQNGEFEKASITALEELVRHLMDKYKIFADNVVRHYDLTGKHCPCYYVDEDRWAVLHERITSDRKAGVLYRVQVGAFSSKENADNYEKKVKEAGFGTLVIKSGDLYHVQVGAFGIKSNAEAYVKTVKAAGFDAFVVEVK